MKYTGQHQEAGYQEENSSEQQEMYQLGTLQSLSYASTVLSSYPQISVAVSFPSHQQMETTTDRQLVKTQRPLTVGHSADTSPTIVST